MSDFERTLKEHLVSYRNRIVLTPNVTKYRNISGHAIWRLAGVLNWTDAILLSHNTRPDHKQKKHITTGKGRVVSGSKASVLRLPKNQCY